MKRLVLALMLGLTLAGCSSVGTGYRGVVLSWNKPTGEVKPEGLYFYNPISTSIVEMSVQTEAHKLNNVAAVSRDVQQVTEDVTVNYNLDPSKVSHIYDNLRTDYIQRVVDPNIQDEVKAITSRYTATDLISHREEARVAMEKDIHANLAGYGINVSQVLLTNIHFSDSFEQAVEHKVTAQQQVQTAQLEAQSAIAQANGEAQSRIIKARADAQAQELQRQTITQALIQKQAVEKWDGHFPQVMGSGNVPFLNIDFKKGE